MVDSTEKIPSQKVLSQRLRVKRHYYRHRAKILEKKRKKAHAAAHKDGKERISDRDSTEKNSAYQENGKHDDWQETRNRTEPPMPDPRLDIPARVPIAKIKPHIISMLSPKPVSLFRVGKNIGITGGLSDATLPDN